MSRTDKTAPWDVKVFYYPSWINEYHDHREGPCDLPSRPRSCKDGGFRMWYGGKRLDGESRCYWTSSYNLFWTSGMSRCPCPMCKRHAFEPSPARVSRRKAKRYCQDGWRDEY